jgi:hypothetical protein
MKMHDFNLRKYVDAQMQEIDRYKWLESEKEHQDIGKERAIFEWVAKFGKTFHDWWFGK